MQYKIAATKQIQFHVTIYNVCPTVEAHIHRIVTDCYSDVQYQWNIDVIENAKLVPFIL